MIIYSIVPHEQIFPEEETNDYNQQIIPCEAGELIVEQVNLQQFRIVRLISGDPANYLNEKYTPGTIIEVKPQL